MANYNSLEIRSSGLMKVYFKICHIIWYKKKQIIWYTKKQICYFFSNFELVLRMTILSIINLLFLKSEITTCLKVLAIDIIVWITNENIVTFKCTMQNWLVLTTNLLFWWLLSNIPTALYLKNQIASRSLLIILT